MNTRIALMVFVGVLVTSRVWAEPGDFGPVTMPIVVTMTDGSVATFARVEPWPGGFARAIRGSGDVVFLPEAKIHRIDDSQGTDVTEKVLVQRKAVDEVPKETLASPKPPRTPKFRGRPSPEQRGFTLVQVGAVRQLGSTVDYEPKSATVMDLGHMWNVSPRHSIGGSLSLATNETFTRVGWKPRYRRWISRTVSVDLAPGVFYSVPGDGEPEFSPVGFVGESSLNFGDWVSVTSMVHVVGTTRRYYDHGEGPAPSPSVPPKVTEVSRTEGSAYLGVKAGGEAAIGATVVSIVVLGLAILFMPPS